MAAADTGDLSEGSNKYYTDARADARIGAASIGALSDVTIGTPTLGEVIQWSGTAWVDQMQSSSTVQWA